MSTIAPHIHQQAEAAWRAGSRLAQAGLHEEAYIQFRLAHDLVVDCPRLHQIAHQHLRRINVMRRAWRELLTDVLLLSLAPLAIFEFVAFMMKWQVLGGVICTRRA